SGIRGPITQASIERVTTSQDQAAAALPDELKYDAFMRSAGTQMPLGFQAWRLDQNGNLVLYFSRSDDWSALQDEERRAVMQALGIGYTAFRLRAGMPVDIDQGRHPVISIAALDGRVLG